MVSLLAMIPSKWVAVAFSVVLGAGAIYFIGYRNGYTSSQEKLLQANEKLLEAERSLARVSLRLAEQESRRLSETASRGTQTRGEYERVKPSEANPTDCISDAQRVFIRQLGAETNSPR